MWRIDVSDSLETAKKRNEIRNTSNIDREHSMLWQLHSELTRSYTVLYICTLLRLGIFVLPIVGCSENREKNTSPNIKYEKRTNDGMRYITSISNSFSLLWRLYSPIPHSHALDESATYIHSVIAYSMYYVCWWREYMCMLYAVLCVTNNNKNEYCTMSFILCVVTIAVVAQLCCCCYRRRHRCCLFHIFFLRWVFLIFIIIQRCIVHRAYIPYNNPRWCTCT